MADAKDDEVKRPAKQKIDDDLWNEIIGEWLVNSLRNSGVSQTSESWNGMQQALPALRAILERKL